MGYMYRYNMVNKGSENSYPSYANVGYGDGQINPNVTTFIGAVNKSQPMVKAQYEIVFSRWPRTIFFSKDVTIPGLTANTIDVNHAGFAIPIATHVTYETTEITLNILADKEGYHYYDFRNFVLQAGHPLVAGDPMSTVGNNYSLNERTADYIDIKLRNAPYEKIYHHWVINNFRPTGIGDLELGHESEGFLEFEVKGTFTHIDYDCGEKFWELPIDISSEGQDEKKLKEEESRTPNDYASSQSDLPVHSEHVPDSSIPQHDQAESSVTPSADSSHSSQSSSSSTIDSSEHSIDSSPDSTADKPDPDKPVESATAPDSSGGSQPDLPVESATTPVDSTVDSHSDLPVESATPVDSTIDSHSDLPVESATTPVDTDTDKTDSTMYDSSMYDSSKNFVAHDTNQKKQISFVYSNTTTVNVTSPYHANASFTPTICISLRETERLRSSSEQNMAMSLKDKTYYEVLKLANAIQNLSQVPSDESYSPEQMEIPFLVSLATCVQNQTYPNCDKAQAGGIIECTVYSERQKQYIQNSVQQAEESINMLFQDYLGQKTNLLKKQFKETLEEESITSKTQIKDEIEDLKNIANAIRYNHNLKDFQAIDMSINQDEELDNYMLKITQLTLPHRFGMYREQIRGVPVKTTVKLEEPSTQQDDLYDLDMQPRELEDSRTKIRKIFE